MERRHAEVEGNKDGNQLLQPRRVDIRLSSPTGKVLHPFHPNGSPAGFFRIGSFQKPAFETPYYRGWDMFREGDVCQFQFKRAEPAENDPAEESDVWLSWHNGPNEGGINCGQGTDHINERDFGIAYGNPSGTALTGVVFRDGSPVNQGCLKVTYDNLNEAIVIYDPTENVFCYGFYLTDY